MNILKNLKMYMHKNMQDKKISILSRSLHQTNVLYIYKEVNW